MIESAPFGIIVPMGEQESIGRRIRRVRELADLTQREFAKPLNVSRGAVGNWERGKGINRENLAAVAENYVVDFAWLATGRGKEPHATVAVVSAEAALAPEGYRMPEVDARDGASDLGAQLREIVMRSGGIQISPDAVSAEWLLPWSFVHSLGIRVAGVAWVVPIVGDSGYDPNNAEAPGSLLPGDRVIVDTSDRRPSPEGPFVVWDGLGIGAKWAELLRGSAPRVRLTSRNPRYRPAIVTLEEARIIGRIRGRISAM